MERYLQYLKKKENISMDKIKMLQSVVDTLKLTEVEYKVDYDHYFKFDSDFCVNSAYGGNARIAYELVRRGVNAGFREFTTCGSRDSDKCVLVALVCEAFGVKCRVFMPNGADTYQSTDIEAYGGVIERVAVGYNNVLVAAAKRYAVENNACYIPFGLESQISIDINMHQVANIPDFAAKRIVIPCYDGINMISVIKGLDYYGKHDVKVLGVVLSKAPTDAFRRFFGKTIFDKPQVEYAFVHSHLDFKTPAAQCEIDGIQLNPRYEAKCIPFLNKGDLLWIVNR